MRIRRQRASLVAAAVAVMVAVAPLGALAHQPGRMTGGGRVFTEAGVRVTHGFELHCIAPEGAAPIEPNNLQVNWQGGNRFHLTRLTRGECYSRPDIDSGQPPAPFEVYRGAGVGRYNGVRGATANWQFTDAGEPGTSDTAWFVIKDRNGRTVLRMHSRDITLTRGNHQAHAENRA